MAEQILPNYYGIMSQAQERGFQRGQRSRLSELSEQAWSAPQGQQQSILARMAGISPEAAQGFEQRAQGQQDRSKQAALDIARAWKSSANAPPEQRQQFYQSFLLPKAQQAGLPLPQNYDPVMFDREADALIAMGLGATGTPAGMQEFNALTQGMSADDVMAARRIKLGLDGRASSAGYSQVKFTGADGRERIGVLNGKTGQIDLPDGTSFNPNTGQIAPTQPMGAPAPAVMSEAGPMPVTQFTGSDGSPVNIGDDLPPHVRQQILQQSQQFAAAPDGAMANMPPANVSPAQFGGGMQSPQAMPQPGGALPPRLDYGRGGNAGAFVGRRAEDEAAAVEAAKQATQLQYLPERQAIETAGKIDQMRAETAIKPTKAQEAVDSQYGKDYVEFISGGAADANKALGELDAVIRQLEGGANLTGPMLGAMPKFLKDRIAAQAAAAQETVESTVQRSLRVILGAQFTEKEGERLIARAYNPSLPESENLTRVQRLFQQLKEGFENKAAAARYYEQNGTLRGFTGKLPSWGDFNPDGAASAAAPAGGVDDLLSKYGVR